MNEEYKLTAEEQAFAESFEKRLNGEDVKLPSFKEFLATPSAKILVPKVIINQVRKAAEPVYLASRFFKTIRMDNASNIVIFPSVGVIRAFDVPEGQEIPAQAVDVQLHEGSNQIRITKSGVRIQLTDEMIDDSMFDVVALNLDAAGRALGRLKEEKAFAMFTRFGHTVFDNAIRQTNPEAGTTGLSYDGTPNDTMSIEDWLDLFIAVYNNEFTPDTCLMHALAWPAFAKTALYAGYDAMLSGMNAVPAPGANFQLGPDSMQGRLPFPIRVVVSPFATIDKANKRFDMVVLDSNNVGVMIQREAITTERFDDPARDIQNIKLKERYGFGVLYEGRAIAVAKNIAIDKAMPMPVRVKTV